MKVHLRLFELYSFTQLAVFRPILDLVPLSIIINNQVVIIGTGFIVTIFKWVLVVPDHSHVALTVIV